MNELIDMKEKLTEPGTAVARLEPGVGFQSEDFQLLAGDVLFISV